MPPAITSQVPSAKVVVEADTHTNIDVLLSWVRSYPERSQVHVVLRRSIPVREGRLLQHSLQALGCHVIARISCVR